MITRTIIVAIVFAHQSLGPHPATAPTVASVAVTTHPWPVLPVSPVSPTTNPSPNRTMTTIARGTFEPKLTPVPMHSPALGRMTIDKEIHGDLEATTQGEMLSAMTAVKGSAGYVAMELVTGTLNGRKGSFVLQHYAFMNRGVPDLKVVVVPDSGTEELVGISGSFRIVIEGKKHLYEFEYTLE